MTDVIEVGIAGPQRPVPSSDYPEGSANWQLFNGSGILTVPNGFGRPHTPGDPGGLPAMFHDPSGLYQSEPYESDFWETTWPAYSWAILPPGVWLCTCVTTWQAMDGYRSGTTWLLDDYQTDYDDYIAVYGTPNAMGPLTGVDGQSSQPVSEIVVVPQGREYRVGYTLQQSTGAPLGVTFLEHAIIRLGF